MVALPFNEKSSLLGESRTRALNRFKTLENRFFKQPQFEEQYCAVIQEYIDLDHAELAENTCGSEGFYLPHHAVIKESSLTTKLRFVFDGSAKTSFGISSNDTLMVGPTVQNTIITHLLRFRLHNFALSGDIEKMYRQIWVRREDRKYQKFLWRDKNGIIKDYQLKTVTFGLAAASFLAIRSLHQLATDEKKSYSTASKIITRDVYVDDLLTGADTLDEPRIIRDEVIKLLSRGNLNIRHWASNDPSLLTGLPENNINSKFQLDSNSVPKTLGMKWQSKNDDIEYILSNLPITVTMRAILAEIAKIVDPLGLMALMVIAARLILQECWQQQTTWD